MAKIVNPLRPSCAATKACTTAYTQVLIKRNTQSNCFTTRASMFKSMRVPSTTSERKNTVATGAAISTVFAAVICISSTQADQHKKRATWYTGVAPNGTSRGNSGWNS